MAQTAVKTPAPAAKTPAKPAEAVKVPGVTRREFLYYVWGASIALALAETSGALVWFILPVFKAGEFGGEFALDPGVVPSPDSEPLGYPAVRFWLLNIGPQGAQNHAAKEAAAQRNQEGVLALYTVCTHLGCLYKWVGVRNRFECPCHGSKYNTNGTYIEGPTPRNLDCMKIQMKNASGDTLAETDADGNPVPIPDGTTQIVVQTGIIIRGNKHN